MKKQAVIITGALGGIGRALCEEFHSQGFAVLAVDRAPGKVSAHRVFQMDILEVVPGGEKGRLFVERLMEAISADDLALKGLLNNAAIQILGGVEALKLEGWRETLDTNLLAPFFLSQALLRPLEENDGAIVNISSIHERLTKPGFVAYATSKAALSGLTRAMAVDLGPRVRVNAICPAAIATPMLRAGFEGKPEAFAALHRAHPSGRIGLPEEVARLARWLVAEAPSFLTGSCLGLDGGISGRLHDPA